MGGELEELLEKIVDAYTIAHPCNAVCEGLHWGAPHYGDPRPLRAAIAEAKEIIR